MRAAESLGRFTGAGTSAVAVRFGGMLTDQDDKSKWRSPAALAPS
jgi:hypothetical protein